MKAPKFIVCLHCGERKKYRGRGLCSSCYERVGSRYPSSRRGVPGGANPSPPPPPEPTDAPPGSAEKVRVLIEREARCVGLWHPLDGRRR